jgi:ferredoxin
MNIANIECLVFSPTGAGLKAANSIKAFLEQELVNCTSELRNITKPAMRESFRELPRKTDYVIILYPVYSDSLPDVLAEYLEKLAIKNLPVSLVAGFANINVGKALSDAREILEAKGNVLCSACAIVVAHSYNGDSLKIAPTEPSGGNLLILNHFILRSIEKAKKAGMLAECKAELPGGRMRLMCKAPQKLLSHMAIKTPKASLDDCDRCMVCAEICPVAAIDSGLSIDNAKCVRCLACVKYCRRKARLFEPRARMILDALRKDEKESKKNLFFL